MDGRSQTWRAMSLPETAAADHGRDRRPGGLRARTPAPPRRPRAPAVHRAPLQPHPAAASRRRRRALLAAGAAATGPARGDRRTVDATSDFDADFRPATDRVSSRWQRVARAYHDGRPLPPVALIERPDGYYIVDGRHRRLGRPRTRAPRHRRLGEPRSGAPGDLTSRLRWVRPPGSAAYADRLRRSRRRAQEPRPLRDIERRRGSAKAWKPLTIR